MTEVKIAAIVEGHGECEAVPILIRRIALDIDPGFVLRVLPPVRVPVSKLLKKGEIERTVIFTARKLQGKGGIIVIADCDWDNGCPAKDGPALLKRAISARNDLPVSVILAKKELVSEVVLLDIKQGVAEGKALDLFHMAPINNYDTKFTGVTDDYTHTANSHVVVITSGIPRQPGMSRDDLISVNAGIVKSVTEKVIALSPCAVIIVVSLLGSKKNHQGAIELKKELFKTDWVFNIGATGLVLILIALYIVFW